MSRTPVGEVLRAREGMRKAEAKLLALAGFKETRAVGSLWLWTREINRKHIYVDKATALWLIEGGFVPEGYLSSREDEAVKADL